MKVEIEKYYTPTIDEFYNGFRYEYVGFDSKPMWIKYSYYNGRAATHTPIAGNNENDFRVKFLDEDDIKELGWVRDKEDDRHHYISFQHQGDEFVQLLYDIEENDLIIIFGLTKLHRFASLDSVLFHGKVRNFNELQRLMEMLDI